MITARLAWSRVRANVTKARARARERARRSERTNAAICQQHGSSSSDFACAIHRHIHISLDSRFFLFSRANCPKREKILTNMYLASR